MENEKFLKIFSSFLKRHNLFGEFICEQLVSLRVNYLELLNKVKDPLSIENLQESVIDKTLWWNETKKGFDFYQNLHNEWKIIYGQYEKKT